MIRLESAVWNLVKKRCLVYFYINNIFKDYFRGILHLETENSKGVLVKTSRGI